MKMLKLCIMMYYLSSNIFAVETIISMFLQKYPYFKSKSETFDPEKYSTKLKQPGYLHKEMTKYFFNTGISGVMALYCGNVAISDHNGMLQFPKLQQEPRIYLLITKGINFNPDYIIAPSTIHNWGQAKNTNLELDVSKNYVIYLITLKEDKAASTWYYQVEESTFPEIEDKDSPHWRHGRFVIPLNTISIIADPQDIFVPTGATITQFSSNLFLPPIYLKKSFCFVYNSLYTLAIKQYFSQEQTFYKLEGQTVSQLQQRKA